MKVVIWEVERCVETPANISGPNIWGDNITCPDTVMFVMLDII